MLLLLKEIAFMTSPQRTVLIIEDEADAAELFADSLRDRYDRDQCDDDILIVYSTNDSIVSFSPK